MTAARGKTDVRFILGHLARAYPDARVLLEYRTPFELLAATVLAAQCTDERVNAVTPALFARYPGPREMAAARREELEETIRPTGFFRNKAVALQALSASLVSRHGGAVPRTMDELTALRGVGRKTAAIVLGACFERPALPVDTHVGRVSFRLGLTRSKDPAKVEEDLAAVVPQRRWWEFATGLGWHGRRVCVARVPRCGTCGLSPVCPRSGVARSA